MHNDFTIRFNNQWYQLLKDQPAAILPKDRVLIEKRLDNFLWFCPRGKYLNYKVLPAKPQKQNNQSWVIVAPGKKERKLYKLGKDHPRRNLPINMPSPTREEVTVS